MENKYVRIPIVAIILIIVAVVICINVVRKQEENTGDDAIGNKTAEFEISDIIAKSGEEITINIKMLEDSSFVAANFELLYDSKQLEYVEYEEGDILKEGAMSVINNDEDNNKISIAYIANFQSETAIVKKGDLANITFKIKKSITDTKINTEFKCTTLKDKDGQDVQNVINQGTIVVK